MSAVIGSPLHAPVAPARLALLPGAPERAVAFDGTGAVAAAAFAAHVRALAERLPNARGVVNLCEDRYRFLVAFCAAAVRGQVTLLPPSRAPQAIDEVLAQHPGSYCLGDQALAPEPPHYLRLPDPLPMRDGAALEVDPDALAAIGFTSGSTGQPKANPKRWGSFARSTAQNVAALADLLHPGAITPVVATVPPQHMYGMEMSVLLPVLAPVAVQAARPFFPDDVARALREAWRPALLVTTPVHLRALVAAAIALPPLAGIVSATAPLSPELAAEAEARFGCEVREMYGATETCILAARRTARESAWTPLPGVRLAPQPDGTAVQAPHLAEPVALADLVELLPDGRFELRGRNADLLEIAGKRASLGDLTRRLLAIPGVEDGVVFQSDAGHAGVSRIVALVVAPSLGEADILAALRRAIDPVFLPRPLRRVDALPRNETGKLPRAALDALLRRESGS